MIIISIILLIFSTKYLSLIWIIFLLGLFLLNKKMYKYFLYFIIGLFIGFVSINNVPHYIEKNEYIGVVVSKKDNYFIFNSSGNKYYIYQENNEYENFDILKIKGKQKDINFSCLESQFNFKEYLYNQKIEKQIEIENINFIFKNPLRKTLIRNNLLNKYDDKSKALISLFLFSNNLDDSFTSKIYDLEIASIFSLSGIQIYFLYEIFNKIILYLTNNKKKSSLVSLFFLSPLLIFSNYKLSFIKAYLTLINKKRIKHLNEIFLIVIIIFNYRFLFTNSFIYIFIIPLIFKKMFNSILQFKKKERKYVQNIFFSLIICVFNLFINGKYNLINMILTPIMLIISKIYLFISLISLILPINIMKYFSVFIFKIIDVLEKIPSIRYLNNYNFVLLIINLILLFLIDYFAKRRLFKLSTFNILIFIVNILFFTSPLDSLYSKYVSFINVGQGDCILIHNKKDNILIDTGGSLYVDIAKDVLNPYFKKNHIKKLDCVFISHNDYDHAGALDNLIYYVNIKEVIRGSSFYLKEVGDLKFYNLNQFYIGEEENINSSVIYFSFLNKNFLMMGDAPIEVENKILNKYDNLNIDIIKIGHHGSNTSSSFKFLKSLSIKEAVISVGLNNKYHHPHQEVLNNLYLLNIIIRRTDEEGTIIYK